MIKLVLPTIAFSIMVLYGVQQYVVYTNETNNEAASQVETKQQQQVSKSQPVIKNPEPVYGRKAKLPMDNRGHFITDAKMNNRVVEVLIDTGATSVAINKTTARRLGINLKPSDFKFEVNTANGKTKAASATIEKIQIGRVTVRDVQAAVLDDKALNSTLLGMSFLSQLKSFEVKNRELLLVQ